MVAEIIGGRLAYNHSGANLVSGVTSTLLASPEADLGLFEVDEGALPQVVSQLHPRVITLGNLFRDQLDRYGELEHIAEQWAGMLERTPHSRLVACVDDPRIGDLADGRPDVLTFGLDDSTQGRGSLQHAADSIYCGRCGNPYSFAAVYVGHLGDYRCPACGHGRPPLDVAAQHIHLHGLDGSEFTLVTPQGSIPLRLALPGLYNVYNATGAAATAIALGTPLEAIAEGFDRFVAAFGRFERIAVGDRGLLMLLIKNPAGANEAIRTLLGGTRPSLAVVALNDAIADGRDVSWIWDVDFEPLLEGIEHVIVSGSRAAELALRFVYGGLDRSRIEVVPVLEEALDRGLERSGPGRELVVLPTYTAMIALRRLITERGHTTEYWSRPA